MSFTTHDRPLWELLSPPSAFGRPERRTTGARGAYLRYADGSELFDATSGLWNVNLGYGNEAIADAVHTALREASYLTLFRGSHDHAIDAAARLIAAAGQDTYRRVVFSTSGGSANDLAMKLARQYAALRGEPQRRLVVGLKGSYHGLTYGAFSLTGEALGQGMYGVDVRQVRHVDPHRPDDFTRLMAHEGHKVAAVVCEPVLGSGVHPVPSELLDAMLALRERYGYLLVADEVATGFGRTGPLFASHNWAARPDVLLTSKGLTNGTCAASAVLVGDRVCAEFDRHDALFVHAETQAGTPPTCAAITETLRQFEVLDALAHGGRTAKNLDGLLADLADRLPVVGRVTGAGCFRGVHLVDRDGAPFDAAAVQRTITAIRAHGALVYPGPGCVQVIPPLTSTPAELETLSTALHKGLADVAAQEARPR
ncbi:daptide-type RiPP biosynthesis aminotransferase [Streptomyces sp. RPT161]|uniref:daptide-type RiPP biosynthesis aminotransferase n=1 Tax=Streptomyces sp. RPT161 TaxID=3015993 RepID=UPI0022B8AE1B|nr:daptide-type RiPP biosynthesis aminotransferase [Streptomyces sp. RPT161]